MFCFLISLSSVLQGRNRSTNPFYIKSLEKKCNKSNIKRWHENLKLDTCRFLQYHNKVSVFVMFTTLSFDNFFFKEKDWKNLNWKMYCKDKFSETHMMSFKEINGCVVLISAEIILCLILSDVLSMTTFASVNYAKRCHPPCLRSLTPYWVVISIPELPWYRESRA